MTANSGQTRPRRLPPWRAHARRVFPSKRTHTGRPDRDGLGPQRTPAVHTGLEKLLNPPGDPRVGFEVQVCQQLCGLADAPEERERSLHDPRDVLAPGLIDEIEAERSKDHVVE